MHWKELLKNKKIVIASAVLAVILGSSGIVWAMNSSSTEETSKDDPSNWETDVEDIDYNTDIEKDEIDYVTSDKETKDRKSTRLNSSHVAISYAVFCLKKKK